MWIKYMYQEPVDVPIKRAEFEVNGGANVYIDISDNNSRIKNVKLELAGVTTATFSNSDWNDFTALVNRINKQIGGA